MKNLQVLNNFIILIMIINIGMINSSQENKQKEIDNFIKDVNYNADCQSISNKDKSENNKLNILWTNSDPVTAELMIMMYAINSKKYGWWNEITIIIWGATTKLVAENLKIQSLIKEAQMAGVKFSACRSCASILGVENDLEKLGIEVIYWGLPLTQIIKSGEKIITI